MAPHYQLHPLGTKLAGALFHLGKQRPHKQNTGRLIRATGIFIVRLVFLLLSLGEDDFIHEEENDHRDTAVQNGGADVVDEVRHQQAGHCHPHTVDGVDDAGDEAESQQIPADLLGEVALAAEDEAALDGGN